MKRISLSGCQARESGRNGQKYWLAIMVVSSPNAWWRWENTKQYKVLKLHLQVGLGPYIGLPDNPDTEELMRVWRQSEKMGIRLQPMTLLASLLRSEAEVMALHSRLKLSCIERDLGLFVVAYRNLDPHPTLPLQPYQWLAVDSKAKIQDTRLFVEQLLLYRGEAELAEQFKQWELPRFPVKGDQLKQAGCPPGRLMSVVLNKLKTLWKEGNFEISSDELVKAIPGILDSIDPAELEREANKMQSGPRLSSKERKRMRKESR